MSIIPGETATAASTRSLSPGDGASVPCPKRVAITQSNYLPWKGYFDLINSVDEVVLYDEMQYTRRDWRNRNRIKTLQGTQWLTVPVEVKGRFDQRIDETRISDPSWGRKHWNALLHAYSRAPCFKEVSPVFEAYLTTTDQELLSHVNRDLIEVVDRLIGITTRITWSSQYKLVGERTTKLVELCRQTGATEYYTGPAARAYLDESAFSVLGISVHYMDYTGYPEYPQIGSPFEHAVSIVDLLFSVGPDRARSFMKTFGQ